MAEDEAIRLLDTRSQPPESLRGAVISIGNFDGVHRGHHRLLAMLRQRARSLDAPAVAVTFEPHPVALIRPNEAPAALCRAERRVRLLEESGVDGVVVYRAEPEILSLTAEEFFRQIVLDRLQARGVVEGSNFGFGKGRKGDIDLLSRLCAENGLTMDVAPLVRDGERIVSSSTVRKLLKEGDVANASKLLGRPHRVSGRVVHGDHRGRAIGFPTANLEAPVELIPAEGVYAGWAVVGQRRWRTAVNVGSNPTFDVAERKIEAHLLDFEGDLYDQTIAIDFIDHIRDVRRFDGLESIRRQLELDVAQTRDRTSVSEPTMGADHELALTIAEWFRQEVEPTLEPIGGSLVGARIDGGVLRVDWRWPSTATPAEAFDLLHGAERRVRAIFPEVSAVENAAPRSADSTTGPADFESF